MFCQQKLNLDYNGTCSTELFWEVFMRAYLLIDLNNDIWIWCFTTISFHYKSLREPEITLKFWETVHVMRSGNARVTI